MMKQVTCEVCGQAATVSKYGPARYCRPCRKQKDREQNRAYYHRQPRERKIRGPNGVFTCGTCGKAGQKRSPTQMYCAGCRPPYRERLSDPSYILNNRMRAGIWATIKGKKNGKSWQKLAGYTCDDLMMHLERQFTPGMSWGNFGDWHIDHRQPLASFTFQSADDPEFAAAWAISNLQPLWASENMSKKDRLTCLL